MSILSFSARKEKTQLKDGHECDHGAPRLSGLRRCLTRLHVYTIPSAKAEGSHVRVIFVIF